MDAFNKSLYIKPILSLNEDIKYIVGNGSSTNPEELYRLYIESKFEVCYQFAIAIYQMYKHVSRADLYDENAGDVIQACRVALEDYQTSAKTLDDKQDFCSWVDQGARKSF